VEQQHAADLVVDLDDVEIVVVIVAATVVAEAIVVTVDVAVVDPVVEETRMRVASGSP